MQDLLLSLWLLSSTLSPSRRYFPTLRSNHDGKWRHAAQQVGGDEPPPHLCARRRAAVRECLVRSTVSAGGGRSPATFGGSVTRMTISKPNLVRLTAAVIGLAASVWFVVAYTHFSHSRFRFEHEGGQLSAINEVLVAYGSWLYVMPLVALPVGLWLVCWRPQATATLEILLSAIWLLALGLAGFSLLIWQLQNVPTFSHMEFHF